MREERRGEERREKVVAQFQFHDASREGLELEANHVKPRVHSASGGVVLLQY